MDQYIKIKKEQYRMNHNNRVPETCKNHAVFIPTFGKDNKGHYYLIDYKTDTLSCWTIDNELIKKILKKKMNVSWDVDAEYFFNNFLAAHSAQFYNNKIYVYSLCSNYVIVLNIEDDKYEVIYNEDDFDMVYSATNDIYNNELYFTGWSLSDMVKIFNDVYASIDIGVGKVNLNSRKFSIFNSYQSGNTIHQTSVTPDGKRIVMLGMSTAPVGKFPNPTEEFRKKEENMLNVLGQGLLKSQISLYNSENNEITTKMLDAGTGHIEYDRVNNYCYVSNHNLGYDAAHKDLYCFGEGQIDKVFIDDKINYISNYKASDFIRIPSHKIFNYEEKTLIAVSVYPNKVHIIDGDTMQIYKKTVIMENKEFTDFTKGPQIYPKIDRTPYTIHPVDNSRYIFLANVWNVRLYDFIAEEVICTTNFNFNRLPLLTMGHALDFNY
jgi:DNA-binding beta-propeller fold protein YncE